MTKRWQVIGFAIFVAPFVLFFIHMLREAPMGTLAVMAIALIYSIGFFMLIEGRPPWRKP